MVFSIPSRHNRYLQKVPHLQPPFTYSTLSSSMPATRAFLICWQGKSHMCCTESETLASYLMPTKYIMVESPWISPPPEKFLLLSGHQFWGMCRNQSVLKLVTLCQGHLQIAIRLNNMLVINSRQQTAQGNQNKSVSTSADCSYRMGHKQSTNGCYHIFPFQSDKKSLTKLSWASRSPGFHYNNLLICKWVNEACSPVVTTFMKHNKDRRWDWQDDSVNIRVWTSTSSIYGILTEKSFSLNIFSCSADSLSNMRQAVASLTTWKQENSSTRRHLHFS